MWSGLIFGLLGAIAAGALWLRLKTVSRKLASFKKSSQLLAEQRTVLELIAKDAEFKVVLDALTLAVRRLTGHCSCAVFLVDLQQGHLVEGSGRRPAQRLFESGLRLFHWARFLGVWFGRSLQPDCYRGGPAGRYPFSARTGTGHPFQLPIIPVRPHP